MRLSASHPHLLNDLVARRMMRCNTSHDPHRADTGVDKFCHKPAIGWDEALGVIESEHNWSIHSLAEFCSYIAQFFRAIRNSDRR